MMFLHRVSLFVAVTFRCFYCLYSQGCTTNAIRLSDGWTEQEGRVEVCLNGVWGTVCDDFWNVESTSVVCRQLGIGDRGYYLSNFPPGTNRPILLDDVRCIGNESLITDCPRFRYEHDCSHSEDVGVVCFPSHIPPECTDGSLRLMDKNTPYSGRLEICQAGIWGTICEFYLDRIIATVACRQIDINATAAFSISPIPGSGPISLFGVLCNGNEESLANCSKNYYEHSDCKHIHDAAVYCSLHTEPECTEGDVRLVDGQNELEGRVEVCQEGLWGIPCGIGDWPKPNGIVVCRQVGVNATDVLSATFGVGNGPRFTSVFLCSGNETSLFNCTIREYLFSCSFEDIVGVICVVSNESVCDEQSVRLVNASTGIVAQDHGLVEICLNGQWAKICGLWDKNEALVVCRQLGFTSPDVIGYLSNGEYGQTVSVSCDAQLHSTLYDCITATSTCRELKYGTAICQSVGSECTNGQLRLVHSDRAYAGRLEMCYLGVWGVVCDDHWIINNAVVACRELGYEAEGATFMSDYTPQGSGPIILDGLRCTGVEQSLMSCIHNDFNFHDCEQFKNVGIYCRAAKNSQNITESTEAEIAESNSIVVIMVAIAGCFCLLVAGVSVLLIAVYIKMRSQKNLSSTNLTFNLEELDPVNVNTEKSTSNEYDFRTRISSILRSINVKPRTNLLVKPSSSAVRGSFVRQLTEDFIIPQDYLTLLVKIGEGEFGIVYKARLSGHNGMNEIVAVKTLKGVYSQEEVDAMLEESLILKHFQHQNVLNLIGVCTEAYPAPYIVMPFMSNGSLLKYLRENKRTLVLSSQDDEDNVAEILKQLTTMCQQISKGMRYLAGEKFLHRDLAARNCMIDKHGIIKIADFGLSEDIYSKTYFRQETRATVKLPVKWMALESLQEGIFSEKTDVWSFGITCWEVFSGGKNPYPGLSPMETVEMLERGERLRHPNNAACNKKMYELMEKCWKKDPDSRPTFAEINNLIDKYLEDMAGYMSMDFNLFPNIKKEEENIRIKSSSLQLQPMNLAPQAREQLNITINITTPEGSNLYA